MVESIYTDPAKKIHPYFKRIRKFRSTKKFLNSPLYKEIKPFLDEILEVCEKGGGRGREEDSLFCRAVSWNVERGMNLDGIIHQLKNHPELNADLYFLPETDVGMARSRNRNVALELASELKLNYAFTPCYLNLDKGNGLEVAIAGGQNNEVGLHGNAFLSKWPIENPRQVVLKNCKDKMRGREKRIGSQRVLVVDVILPSGPLRAVCIHMDAHSSQRQRFYQMKTVLDFLAAENWKGPTLIGGDWNTSTYCASHAFFAFFSFWRKVAMGSRRVCERHYPYPERYFERRLFELVEKKGFDYKNFNVIGAPTMHYQLGDEIKNKNLRDWTPKFFQIFVDWAMKKAQGLAQFKIDWFAAQGLKPIPNSQKVVGHLAFQDKPISDHDAIVTDFTF